MSATSSFDEQPVEFTKINSDKILELEKEIAYFFGAKNPELVAEHYMQAIKTLEEQGSSSTKEKLCKEMVPSLEKAYLEVKNQTSLHFDEKKAASYEFELIFAQSKKAAFEEIYVIMVNLYHEIFRSEGGGIQKAALLRTFLYTYKTRLLSLDKDISEVDLNLLINIAKRSEEEFNRLK